MQLLVVYSLNTTFIIQRTFVLGTYAGYIPEQFKLTTCYSEHNSILYSRQLIFYVRFKQILVFTRRSVAAEAHVWSRVRTCEISGKVSLGLYILRLLQISHDNVIPAALHVHLLILILSTAPRRRRKEWSLRHFEHPVLVWFSGRFGRKLPSKSFFAFKVLFREYCPEICVHALEVGFLILFHFLIFRSTLRSA
jgi:hypothetical protein